MIRRARREDAEAIAAVRGAGEEAWVSWLRGQIADPASQPENWVAEVDGRVAGWAAVGPPRDADVEAARTGELWAIYAAPGVQGRGVGYALFRRAVAITRAAGRVEMVLWVLPDNARARAFYERQGMRADGGVREVHGEGHLRYRLDLGHDGAMRLDQVILFVKDLRRMTAFYEQALSLAPLEGSVDEGYVRLDAGACALLLHAMPAEIAAGIEIADPPRAREENPVKLAFASADVDADRARVAAHGAVMGAVKRFDRLVLCDGTDPEGNVFQLSRRG